MLCNDLEGWDGKGEGSLKRKGMYVYTWLSDSHCGTAETNTTL